MTHLVVASLSKKALVYMKVMMSKIPAIIKNKKVKMEVSFHEKDIGGKNIYMVASILIQLLYNVCNVVNRIAVIMKLMCFASAFSLFADSTQHSECTTKKCIFQTLLGPNRIVFDNNRLLVSRF